MTLWFLHRKAEGSISVHFPIGDDSRSLWGGLMQIAGAIDAWYGRRNWPMYIKPRERLHVARRARHDVGVTSDSDNE